MDRRLIYIAGYGRSGSTVLGTLLAAHPDAIHVGEIAFLFEDLAMDRACSCGLAYADCGFWRPILKGRADSFASYGRVTRRIENYKNLLRLHSGRLDISVAQEYAALHRSLFSDVRVHSGASVVIDSSKSAWATTGRFLALERLAREQVHVIHLIRSGRATMQSLLEKGSNWELEGRIQPRRAAAARAAIGWTGINYITSRLGAGLGKERYLRLRYEDLVRDPLTALGRVGEFVGLDLSPLIRSIEHQDEFSVGHAVGGNRLRFARKIRLATSVPAIGRLEKRHRAILFTAVGGWLERRYGYR